MEDFVYKKIEGVTALSAHLTHFEYKKHAHEEYALGVTLKGLQQYSLEGETKISYPNDVMGKMFFTMMSAFAELENIKLIEKYILDDYFSIFKKKIKVKRKKYRMIGTNALEISYKSYKYSKTSKHSKAKKEVNLVNYSTSLLRLIRYNPKNL